MPLRVCTITIRSRHRPGILGSLDTGRDTHVDRGFVILPMWRSASRTARLPSRICCAPSPALSGQGRAAPERGPSRRVVRRPASEPPDRGPSRQNVRNRRPSAPKCIGSPLVHEVELLDETRQRTRLVNCVEILALNVLDQRDRERFPVAEFAHHRGDPHNPRRLCRAIGTSCHPARCAASQVSVLVRISYRGPRGGPQSDRLDRATRRVFAAYPTPPAAVLSVVQD